MSVDSRGSFLQPMPGLVAKEVTAKSELIRIKPETIPYLPNEMDDSLISEYANQVNGMYPSFKKYPDLSYAILLGGETRWSCKTSKRVDYSPLIKENLYPDAIHRANGYSSAINTGVDLNHLITQYPNDRWKFYLSLDTTSAEKGIKANLFLREFVERCKEHKISLLMKTEDHDYDNPDIYTWQPATMSKILQELYSDSKYAGIWFDTEHYFQKPINGVSSKHIGLVQEPIFGFKGESHSNRMLKLGERIDETISKVNNGGSIGFLTFFDAAKRAGVEPTQPWRINRHRLDENRQYLEATGLLKKS